MGTMKSAWLTAPGHIEIRKVERPDPGPRDVVVRVHTALTCGTDLKAYLRGHRFIPMPGPFGHEYAGTVEGVGRDVDGFVVGDAVMGVHSAPCGRCYWCERGEGNLCPDIMRTKVLGAYAEYVLVPGHIASVNLFHKPPHLPFAEAALLEPLSCVVHGLRDIDVHPDDTVLIIGPGAIGLLHLAVLRAKGCRRVIVAGRGNYRIDRAKRLGAAAVVDVRNESLAEVVANVTDGRGADVVVECTGQKNVWEAAPSYCRRGGHVVLFGGLRGRTEVGFDAARLHYDQITLHSPFHFTPSAVAAARALLVDGLAGVSHLISASLPLTSVPEAFEMLQGGDYLKFAILPGADGNQEQPAAVS